MSEIQSKNSILQINAVQCVYVELCYKNFTSKCKKSNYNIDISNVSDLPFYGICFSIGNEVDDTVPKEPTIDMFPKTICKKRCKCFDIVLGFDGKKQGTLYRNISRFFLE